MVSKLNDCIGNTMSESEELNKENTLKLVGFIPTNKNQSLVAGSHFIEKGQTENLENDQGWMSSVAFSPMLKHSIGLGYIVEEINDTVRKSSCSKSFKKRNNRSRNSFPISMILKENYYG